MNLEHLGADPQILAAFAPHSARGLALGRVSFYDRDRCRLFTAAGEIAAEIAGALWHRGDNIAVGDWVAARPVDAGLYLVDAVLPRRTRFVRRAAGRREDEQVVAANIDVVLLVSGLDHDFNPRRLERYLALAWESGASPVVVLNKADLCTNLETAIAEAAAVARAAPVITASATKGQLDQVRAWLGPGRTVALLGSSGAGKSTLVNALIGEQRQRTAEVRESDSRGRHATTARELVSLPEGGILVDTPGMRELQLWADQDSLDLAFDEIAALAAGCRFRDCGHSGEPGCAVAAAMARGEISSDRWESYRKLRSEVRRHERLADTHASLKEKRRFKMMNKALRQHYKLNR